MDVEAARRAGMGAALYRGLSKHYWDPDKLPEVTVSKDSAAPCLDHLSEVTGLLNLR